jgi:hypothetical protein
MFEGDWLRFFSDTTSLVLFALTLLAVCIPLWKFLKARWAA